MLEEEVRDLASSIGPIAIRQRLGPASGVNTVVLFHRGVGRSLVLLSADCLAFVASGLVAYCIFLKAPDSLLPRIDFSVFCRELALPFAGLILYQALSGRYTTRVPFWTETYKSVSAGLFTAGMEAALAILLGNVAARLAAVVAILLASVLAVAANRAAKYSLSAFGLWQLPVVIIGDEALAAEVEAALSSDNSLGYRVVGTASSSSIAIGSGPLRLFNLLAQHGAECLLIALDDAHQQHAIIESALRERLPFATVILPGFCCHLTRMLGHNAMLLWHASGLLQPSARLVKSTFDIAVASLLLLLASPLLALIAFLVRADGGAVLFRHRRLGAGGRHFRCLKFRTMVRDAEQVLEKVLACDPERAAEWRETQKLRDDPRVTRIGRFLRGTSLDELPQLINIVRRDMSLVGPRPIVDNEVEFYGADIAHYYAIRPGLTGLWQVSGRSDTSYARRVQLDVWYVNNWTIWCDISVLLKTIPAVFRRRGAR